MSHFLQDVLGENVAEVEEPSGFPEHVFNQDGKDDIVRRKTDAELFRGEVNLFSLLRSIIVDFRGDACEDLAVKLEALAGELSEMAGKVRGEKGKFDDVYAAYLTETDNESSAGERGAA